MKKAAFLFFVILGLFVSCGEMTPVEETASRNAGFVSLKTFEEGRILKAGGAVDYALSFAEDTTDIVSFRIDIIDMNLGEAVYSGTPVRFRETTAAAGSQTSGSVSSDAEENVGTVEENDGRNETEKADNPDSDDEADYKGTFQIPETLSDGYYSLLFSFEDASGRNAGTVNASFFISSIRLKVNSLGSYPAIIYPGGESLLYTDITAPDGFDADVVWYCNGVEIYRTRLKNMSPAVKWRAPADKTAVEMSVGIYPCDSPAGEPFSFRPPVALTSTIFISANQSSESSDFRPDSEYDMLFHFRGEMNDYSPYAKNRKITVKGNPQLAFDTNVFGYSFADGAAIEIVSDDESVLGYDGSRFVSSAVDFRLNLKSDAAGKIFSVKDDAGQPVFSLSKNGTRLQLTTELSTGPFVQALNLSDYTLTDLNRLSFVVFQNVASGQFSFVWGLDGYSVSGSVFGHETLRRLTGRTFVIGGEDGYTGVIDEFGIFRIDEPLSGSLFNEAVKKKFGEACLFADDFVGTSTVSSYRKYPVMQPIGYVTVSAGEVLETSAYAVPENQFSVQVAVAGENFAGGSVDVKMVMPDQNREWLSETVAVSLNLSDGCFSTAEGDSFFEADGSAYGLYRMDFRMTANGWVCLFAGETFRVNIPEGASVAVSVSAGEGESVSIDSLVLLGNLSGQADVYKTPVTLVKKQ